MSKTVTLQQDGDDVFLPLDDEMMREAGLRAGDVVQFNVEGDTIVVTKKPTKLVMVETISMFRMRYLVSMPADAPDEWALDSVVCNDVEEFSQKHLDEVIVSSREVTAEEYIKTFDADNDYLASWPEQQKMEYAHHIGVDDEKESVIGPGRSTTAFDDQFAPPPDVEHSKYYYDTDRNR